MNLSIVIPLLNEQESLPELHNWIVKVMTSHNFSYEILFIDDGSTDASWSTIEQLSEQNPNVKGIRFLKNYGKSQALHAGFAKAQGDVIITMDADLQDSPDEIPELYNLIYKEGFDLISGWKKKRYDSVLFKNIPSKLFNWAARRTSGVKLNDFKILVVGECYGDENDYIQLAEKNDVLDVIDFRFEFVPHESVNQYFCAADLVVLPYKSATQSGVVPIAYHFDKPVVVSNIGGLPEIVRNGETGFICEPDAKQFAEGIIKYYNSDPGRFSTFISEYKEQFSWEIYVKVLLELIEL